MNIQICRSRIVIWNTFTLNVMFEEFSFVRSFHFLLLAIRTREH